MSRSDRPEPAAPPLVALQRRLLEVCDEQYCTLEQAFSEARELCGQTTSAPECRALVAAAIRGLVARAWLEGFNRWRLDEPRPLEPLDEAALRVALSDTVPRQTDPRRELLLTSTLAGQEALRAGLLGASQAEPGGGLKAPESVSRVAPRRPGKARS